MVTQSNLNWPKHKEEVRNYFKLKYGEKTSNEFMEFYESRGNPYNRSYVHYLLAWNLYDDFKEVESSGLRWYAFVGAGGTGKTTLAKCVFSYLDPTFNQKRIVFNAFDFVELLYNFNKHKSMKAALLDEPDSTIYPTSKEGIKLRSILGKARQQALFLGYCATDMRDIPGYIYKKLSGVFFCPFKGQAMFFKDRPKKKSYVMQVLKQEYEKIGYKTFFKNQKSMGCVHFPTYNNTPFTKEDEISYKEEKQNDYVKDIEDFLKMKKAHKEKEQMNPMQEVIVKLYNNGMPQVEIAKTVGLTKGRISQIVNKSV